MLARILFFIFICLAAPRMVYAAQDAGIAHSRIALVRVAEPVSYESWLLSPAQKPDLHVTGLWNMRGLLKEARSAMQVNNITDAIVATGFRLSDWFTTNLKQALEKAGYEVVLVDRPGNSRLTPSRMPTTQVPVDAYLDVRLGFAGYVADQPGTAYSPVIEAPALLVTPDGKKPIYTNTFRYGSAIPAVAPGKIADNHAYDVANLDGQQSIQQIINGFKGAASQVAQLMARQMQ